MGLYELRTVYAPAPGRDVLAWMDDAVCRAGEWDLMDTDMQQRTCVRCPVRDECRDYADQVEGRRNVTYLFDVWGGETPQQRASRRRRTSKLVKPKKVKPKVKKRRAPARKPAPAPAPAPEPVRLSRWTADERDAS